MRVRISRRWRRLAADRCLRAASAPRRTVISLAHGAGTRSFGASASATKRRSPAATRLGAGAGSRPTGTAPTARSPEPTSISSPTSGRFSAPRCGAASGANERARPRRPVSRACSSSIVNCKSLNGRRRRAPGSITCREQKSMPASGSSRPWCIRWRRSCDQEIRASHVHSSGEATAAG